MDAKPKPAKFTIADFNRMFPDEDVCLDYVRDMVYPEGITCRKCGVVRPHSKIEGRKAYACAHCGTHVYPLAGTIFEKSSTSLKSWFYAMYLMSSTRCGISAKHLERELGVTYKTAWRMFTQIRKMLDHEVSGIDDFSGAVEVDETYVGGKRPGKRGRGAAGKTIAFGIVERHGRVAAQVVPDVKAATLLPVISERVLPASMIYSDEMASYTGLAKRGYQHRRIHHAAKVYVMGDVHTNTIEGFWSLVKRDIDGAHHAVSAKYLQQYINAYAFRWNHRDDDLAMYKSFVGCVPRFH